MPLATNSTPNLLVARLAFGLGLLGIAVIAAGCGDATATPTGAAATIATPTPTSTTGPTPTATSTSTATDGTARAELRIPDPNIESGDVLQITVWVDPAGVPIGGGEFTIHYRPDQLRFLTSSPGPQMGERYLALPGLEQAPGAASLALALIGTAQPANGPTELALFTFQVITEVAAGTVDLTLDPLLLGVDAGDISIAHPRSLVLTFGPTLTETATPTQTPELMTLMWEIVEGRIIIDPGDKYWEKYHKETSLPGLYLRLKNRAHFVEAFGDYMELRSDGTYEAKENGRRITGQWRSAGNEIVLTPHQ